MQNRWVAKISNTGGNEKLGFNKTILAIQTFYKQNLASSARIYKVLLFYPQTSVNSAAAALAPKSGFLTPKSSWFR